MGEILKVENALETNWFTLLKKVVKLNYKEQTETFYSILEDDYVSVLTETENGKIILVKQYRPAVENYTLELPAGHVEKGMSPEIAAKNEVEEETGLRVIQLSNLGLLEPDTGRMSNKQWAFYAKVENPADGEIIPSTELGVEVEAIDKEQFKELILEGRFIHSLHLAVIFLATLKGKLRI